MTEDRTSAPAPGVYTPPQERSTHGCSSGAAEEHPRSKEHPVDEKAVYDLTVELNQRLDKAMADYKARQERTKAQRAEFARRRAAGLIQRYAAKAARNRRAQQDETG